MFVTLDGIAMDFRLEQSENEPFSILITPFGIIEPLHPTISVFVSVIMIALQLSRES